MKRLFAAVLLLFGTTSAFATGATEIAAGRAALAAHDLASAQTHFSAAVDAAVLADDAATSDTAEALLGFTRVFALTSQTGSTAGQTSTVAFLTGLGVPTSGRDLYNWSAKLPKDGSGNLVLPAAYNATTVETFWRTTLVPEMAAARANFAAMNNNSSFLLTLYPWETNMPATVNIDYGDVLMAQASLSAVEFAFHFLSGQNLNANLDALNQLAQGNLLTLQKMLADNPSLFTVGSTSERAAAQAAVSNFIDLYRQASGFIRNVRPAGVSRLFMLDPKDLAQEEDFRAHLDKVLLSFTEPVSFDQGKHFGFAKPLFDSSSTWSARAQMPTFNAATGGFDFESIADPSLGGVVGGFTREKIANLFNASDTTAELGWTWLSPTPQGNGLLRVVSLGGNNLIATGFAGTILLSADNGTTWTAQRLRGEGGVNSVATDGAGKIVLVTTGAFYLSTNGGTTWVRTLDNLSLNARAVTYGGGKFVTVGGFDTAMTSSDGSTWTSATVFASNPNITLNDVAYTGSLFVAVGADNSTTASGKAVVFTSPNGTTWTNAFTAAATGYTFDSVAFNATADKFVAVGTGNNIAVATVPTGTWTPGTVTGAGTTIFNGVAFRNGVFVAVGVGGTIATSPDGSSWNAAIASGETQSLNGVGVSASATFVAVANGAILKTTDAASAASYARVLNPPAIAPLGTTLLTARTIPTEAKIYVAGTAGTLLSSVDGSTFTTLTSGTFNTLWSVSNKQGTLVYAVGDAGTVINSTNSGANWNPDATTGIGSGVSLRSVAYLGGRWIVTGTNATLAVNNTSTWAIPATLAGATSADVLYDAAWGNSTFVAVGGNNGGSNYVYTSTDAGVTWTRRTIATNSTFHGVVFNQGYFTAAGSGGAIFRSADGIAWSPVDAGSTYDILSLRVFGGRYYAFQARAISLGLGGAAATQQTAVLVSSDGLTWTRLMTGTANQLYSGDFFGGRLYAVGDNATVLRSEAIPGQANPVIAVPVTTLSESQGTDRLLAAFPNGDGGESYEWRKNGSFLATTSGPALDLKNLQAGDAGSYVLNVTNANGLTSSTPIVLSVNGTPVAPTITQQPVSQTVNVGLTATLSVVADGTAPLSYQWQKDTGTGPTNLTDGGNVSGSGTATLSLTNVQSTDAAAYTVVVTGTGSPATSDQAILAVDSNPAYTFTTLAGLAGNSGSTTNVSGGSARFSGPSGVAVDASGNVYVADTINGAIRKIDSTGFVTTLASGGGNPFGIVLVGSTLYYTTTNHAVRSVPTSGGSSSVLVGLPGTSGTAEDPTGHTGAASLARFNTPRGIVADSSGLNLYVADNANQTIRKIVIATGVVSTFAGTAGADGQLDAVGAAARFHYPDDLAIDAAGNLYVAESFWGYVRKIAPDATVTTFLSYSMFPGLVDGPAGIGTPFAPFGIAADGAGNVYFTEGLGGQVVRRASPTATIRTIGGQPFTPGSSDGVGSGARFNNPIGVAVDAAGNVYIADNINNTIRKGVPSASLLVPAISLLPKSQTVSAGGNATFSVTADGPGTLSYQWRKNGVNIGGATSPSLTLTNLQSANAGNYTVLVTNSQGSAVSAVAALTVDPDPEITGSPVNQTIAVGSPLTMSVTALGANTLTYQWFKNGVALANGGSVAGATTATLTVTNAQTTDSGSYYAIVGNSTGSEASATATVVVYASTPYTFFTLAGRAALGADDAPAGPGSLARFNNPQGIAHDNSGNLFVGDLGNHTIRKIVIATGVVTTFAGLSGVPGSADGTGSAAQFNGPEDIQFDPVSGNLYVTDFNNSTVRKITPGGGVSTLAGSPGLAGSADGTGSAARFNTLRGMAVDATGSFVYVADSGNNVIRKIEVSTGIVTTFAGLAGQVGSADGTGSAARFKSPEYLAVDAAGNLYVADTGNDTIRFITSGGVVSTLAGQAGSAGNADGVGAAARFSFLLGLTRDAVTGNLYVTDSSAIRQIAITTGPVATVTTLAGVSGSTGNLDLTGTAARFSFPIGITVDAAGANLYIGDHGNNTVRQLVVSTKVVTTLAGSPPTVGSTNGAGSVARFNLPESVAPDGAGNVYVADTNNHTIRKIAPNGTVSLFSGTAGTSGSTDGAVAGALFKNPAGVATDSAGNLYIADRGNNTIRKYTVASGNVATLAGSAGSSGSADGTGSGARFNGPSGLAVDRSGNVYVADRNNQTVRKITPGGVVTTLAGLPFVTGTTDGTGSDARFNNPGDVAVDSNGNVYVADFTNQRLRKITPAGVVTTVIQLPGGADGVGVDAADNVYPLGNSVVFKITPAGVVTAIAGLALNPGSADGTGSAARFNGGWNIKADSAGNLFFADGSNNTIRKGYDPTAPVIGLQPVNQTATAGTAASFTVGATSANALAYQWQRNGDNVVSRGTSSTLVLPAVQSADAGIYRAVVTGSGKSVTSVPAILGVATTSKVIGAATEVASNIVDLNGNIYDYVLLTGVAATVTADPGQITRVNYIDLNDDLVTVEFSGAGALTITLDNATGPAAPLKYNQPTVFYMKGQAGLVVTGADQTTNVSVFSLGSLTVTNQAILRNDVTYDGVADLAFIAIESTNGQFGGVRATNARFSAAKGLTGIFAPGVTFTGPIFVGDIDASGTATPVLIFGSSTDTRIAGGDLLQTNNQPVLVSGLTTPLNFVAGLTSGGGTLPAQTNHAVLQTYVVGPTITAPPPAFATGAAGSNFSLPVQATGGAFTYQWSKFGQTLAGQTGASLVLNPLAPADAGLYTVQVFNGGVPFFTSGSRVTVAGASNLTGGFTAAAAFGAALETDGGFNCVQRGSDGKIYLAGNFSTIAGVARPGIARLNTDGSLDTTWAPVSANNTNTVSAFAVQADGKVIIGGGFTTVGGFPHNQLARLNADGSVDLTFNPAISIGTVNTLLLQADGKVVAGGNGSGAIVRVNPDGSTDGTFSAGTGFNGPVSALAFQPSSGQILAVGSFTSYNGSTISGIARLGATGTLDASFNPTGQFLQSNGEGGFFQGSIAAVAVQSDGKVLVGGAFTRYPSSGTTQNYLARLNADGSPDTTYNASLGTGFNSSVSTLDLLTGDSVLAGGFFNSFNGTAAKSLVRVLVTGLRDAGFDSTTGLNSGTARALALPSGQVLAGLAGLTNYNGTLVGALNRFSSGGARDATYTPFVGTPGNVLALVPAPNGKWIVAGSFRYANGIARNNLARLNANGSTDLTFDPGTGFSSNVYSVAVQPDGKVIATGIFTSFNNVAANRIVRLDTLGALDPGFTSGSGFNDFAGLVALDAVGNIYVAGSFTSYNGNARHSLVRLLPDGTLDPAFVQSGTGIAGPYVFYHVGAILPLPDGKIYVGGDFPQYGADTTAHTLVRLNADGSRDLGFDPSALGGGVNDLAIQPADGKLLVVGVTGTGINLVGRLFPDGSIDSSFTVTNLTGSVSKLLLQPDGSMILNGGFTSSLFSGSATLARVSAGGVCDPAFQVPGFAGQVNAMQFVGSGTLLIGGQSLSFSNRTPAGLALLEALPDLSVTAAPVNATVTAGSTVTLSLANSVTGTFQWLKNGLPIAGANTSTLTLASTTPANTGDYSLAVTIPDGLFVSATTTVRVVERDLLGLMSHAIVPAGGSVAASFTIEGSTTRSILIRGVGPGLASASVNTASLLRDPRLTLMDGTGATVQSNDNWGSGPSALSAAFTAVGAFPLLNGSYDAALLVTLSPGTYTAFLDGADGGGGAALLEIYDAGSGNSPRIVMLTTRAHVGTNSFPVAGFTVAGTGSKSILVRVLGEALGSSDGILEDPMVTVYNSSNVDLGFNDDWQNQVTFDWSHGVAVANPPADVGTITAAAATAGASPLDNSLDSTVLLKLPAGAYTAQVTPFSSGATGEVFIEIFDADASRPASFAPAITYLARNQFVTHGGSAFFGVNVIAKPAPTYQWRQRVGAATPTAIGGATGPVLALGNVQPGDVAVSGVPVTYDVVITNSAGSVTSAPRALVFMPSVHSADFGDGLGGGPDGRIDIIELTRVLQLYNYTTGTVRTGQYHTQAGTEDGFAPGPGPITTFHSADTNHDGTIDATELSRVIELYNFLSGTVRTGQYHLSPGTEDGFAPGPFVGS